MPDIPLSRAVAHGRGALVIDDNTWATPLFHRSLDQGVEYQHAAATKYIGGHSDIISGPFSESKAWPPIAERSGCSASAPGRTTCFSRYVVYRTPRRSACTASSIRPRDGAMARDAARGCQGVTPALESDPGHTIWKTGFYRRRPGCSVLSLSPRRRRRSMRCSCG